MSQAGAPVGISGLRYHCRSRTSQNDKGPSAAHNIYSRLPLLLIFSRRGCTEGTTSHQPVNGGVLARAK